MKLAVRAFILGICAVGASAAVVSSHSATSMVSHQAVLSTSPIPNCPPSGCAKLSPIPNCPPNGCSK